VSDSVAAQLEQLILQGRYRVGDRLPAEPELANQFGVGRSSLREALRRVETDGLITIYHGRGTWVTADVMRPARRGAILHVEGFTVPDFLDVRLTLEAEAAAVAARRIGPEQTTTLQQVVTAADEPSLTDHEFIQLDWRIHRGVAAATGNPVLLHLTDMLEHIFIKYSHRVIQLPERRALAQAGHHEIVEAVVNHRVRPARAAARRHIQDVERDIAEHLARDEADADTGGV
jgi:GntR family transcriptional repressor for pyruvate dehydrogenase complex